MVPLTFNSNFTAIFKIWREITFSTINNWKYLIKIGWTFYRINWVFRREFQWRFIEKCKKSQRGERCHWKDKWMGIVLRVKMIEMFLWFRFRTWRGEKRRKRVCRSNQRILYRKALQRQGQTQRFKKVS